MPLARFDIEADPITGWSLIEQMFFINDRLTVKNWQSVLCPGCLLRHGLADAVGFSHTAGLIKASVAYGGRQ